MRINKHIPPSESPLKMFLSMRFDDLVSKKPTPSFTYEIF